MILLILILAMLNSGEALAVNKNITINIYKSSELADKFETKEVSIESLSAQDVINALADNSSIPSDIKVNKFEQIGETINLDVSIELANKLKQLGTTGEKYTMGSIVNTMLTAYNAKEIKITADGKIIETGHSKYDTYMTMYK